MKISCIIIEDEPLAMSRIRGYVLKSPSLQLLSTFDHAAEALAYLKIHRADLIFLDINLGALSGISMLETELIESRVIITTAYHEYAVKGYELNVTDYLLKPFSFDRFTLAVNKALDSISKSNTEEKFIFVKSGHKLEKISLNEILYIEGLRDYRKIYTVYKTILIAQTFRELEMEIPPEIICRVHRSYMVSLSKINSIEKDMIHIRQASIPISETFKKDFFELIGRGDKKSK